LSRSVFQKKDMFQKRRVQEFRQLVPQGVEIEILEIPENAEASIRSTSFGILTNSSAE
jgi:hypothetical protein